MDRSNQVIKSKLEKNNDTVAQHAVGNRFLVFGALFFLVFSVLATGVSAAPGDDQTYLLVNFVINGPHEHAGDAFELVATVQNVGPFPAKNVEGTFLGTVPAGWSVSPNPDSVDIGLIQPREVKAIHYTITRDAEDATLAYGAQGINTLQASSNRVRVPVSPLVLGGLAITMLGITWVHRRKNTIPTA